MAREQTPVSVVTTDSFGTPGTLDPHHPVIVPGALEQQISFLAAGYQYPEGINMLEIVIHKAVGGRDLRDQFSNTYLFNGAHDYTSAEALALVIALRNAEARIYFNDTQFMKATIRQLALDGTHNDGETRSIPLTGEGLSAMPAGSTHAADNVCLGIAKRVLVGRAGVQLYRHAITSDEYNAWIEGSVAPPRIVAAQTFGDEDPTLFIDALAAVGVDQDMQLILPPNPRYAGGAPRPVVALAFAGLRDNQEHRQKDDAETNTKEAVQQSINENGRKIAKLLRQSDTFNAPGQEGMRTQLLTLAGSLKRKVQELAESLSIQVQADLRWPAVYADIRIIIEG